MIVIMDVYECEDCNSHYAVEHGMKDPCCSDCLKYSFPDEKVKQIEVEIEEE